jgi:hypothetical protein
VFDGFQLVGEVDGFDLFADEGAVPGGGFDELDAGEIVAGPGRWVGRT